MKEITGEDEESIRAKVMPENPSAQDVEAVNKWLHRIFVSYGILCLIMDGKLKIDSIENGELYFKQTETGKKEAERLLGIK